MVLIPLENATPDEYAAKAITQIIGTSLVQRGGILLHYAAIDNIPVDPLAEKKDPSLEEYLDFAKEKKAAYLVAGVVHEYHYKTDLDGDPAIGLTVRLLNPKDGSVLWQGTSSNVGFGHSSLTSAAQKAVQDIVALMPVSPQPKDAAQNHTPKKLQKPASQDDQGYKSKG